MGVKSVKPRTGWLAAGVVTAALALSMAAIAPMAHAEAVGDETIPTQVAQLAADSQIAPYSFFETVINTYDAFRSTYAGYKFNISYRTINYYGGFYVTGHIQTGTKGYDVWPVYNSSGQYLGNTIDWLDSYRVDYKIY